MMATVAGILTTIGIALCFNKARLPAWAAVIPIYNVIVLLKLAGKSPWSILLFLVPLLNIYILIMMYWGIARRFGKGIIFMLGLIFMPFIFFPVLGLSDAAYRGRY